MKTIKEIENKFDEFFPLSIFSTENYQGREEELEFTRWQDFQTKSALARSNRLKAFIYSSIYSLLEGIEEKLPVERKQHCFDWDCPRCECDREFNNYRQEVVKILNSFK
jgi:hypothetical protein